MKSKKIAAFVMSGVLSAVMALNGTVYANGVDAQTDYEEYVLENSEEGKITPESTEKFNLYIASLDSEIAEAVLNDDELVYCMKLDTYWLESDEADIMTYASVTLPLASFPADGKTYFSADKSVGCECHFGTCGNKDRAHDCTYVIPSGFSTARCYSPETGKSGTCRRYNNSIQCKAFADYVYKTYTGKNCTASNSTTDYDISESAWSAAKVKSTLRGIPKGSNVRGYLSSGFPHSIIVLSTDASGIKYYHANKDNHCLVAVDTKTWAEFADYFCSIYDVWIA